MTMNINSFPNVTGSVPSLPNFGNPMFQQQTFLTTDQQRIKTLEDELASVKAKLAEKEASTVDIDKQLAETEKGCEYLRAKYDGATKLIIEWAMGNSMLSAKMGAFLDGWRAQAQAFLDKKESVNDHPGS